MSQFQSTPADSAYRILNDFNWMQERPDMVPFISEIVQGEEEHEHRLEANDISHFELVILRVLDWRLKCLTYLHFLDFQKSQNIVNANDRVDGLTVTDKVRSKLIKYVDFYADMLLLDPDFHVFPLQLASASMVAAARITMRLSPVWPESLEADTGFSAHMLAPCVNQIITIFCRDWSESAPHVLHELVRTGSCALGTKSSTGIGVYERAHEFTPQDQIQVLVTASLYLVMSKLVTECQLNTACGPQMCARAYKHSVDLISVDLLSSSNQAIYTFAHTQVHGHLGVYTRTQTSSSTVLGLPEQNGYKDQVLSDHVQTSERNIYADTMAWSADEDKVHGTSSYRPSMVGSVSAMTEDMHELHARTDLRPSAAVPGAVVQLKVQPEHKRLHELNPQTHSANSSRKHESEQLRMVGLEVGLDCSSVGVFHGNEHENEDSNVMHPINTSNEFVYAIRGLHASPKDWGLEAGIGISIDQGRERNSYTQAHVLQLAEFEAGKRAMWLNGGDLRRGGYTEAKTHSSGRSVLGQCAIPLDYASQMGEICTRGHVTNLTSVTDVKDDSWCSSAATEIGDMDLN
jgi:hypothetical protein